MSEHNDFMYEQIELTQIALENAEYDLRELLFIGAEEYIIDQKRDSIAILRNSIEDMWKSMEDDI